MSGAQPAAKRLLTEATAAGGFAAVFKPEAYGAKGDGTTDDTAALQSCVNAAIAAGTRGVVELAGVTYKITAGLTVSSSTVRIRGAGAGVTVIAATANTYDLLTVGDGNGAQVRPTGYLRDLTVRGPSATPASNGKAAVKINGLNQFRVDDVAADNMDIGFDLVNNCYGAQFTNVRAGFGGSCNVGVNLRTGAQSGSDVAFFNPWVAGRVAGFYCAGGGGGYHIYGGQVAGGMGTSAVNDSAGALVLGRDYLTGATGETSVDVHGTSFEGTTYAWLVRAFDQSVLTWHGVYANPAVSNAPAVGLYKATGAKNSKLILSGTTISGYWSAGSLVSVAGGYDDFAITEVGTYPASQQPTIAGTQVFVRSIAQQSGFGFTAVVLDSLGLILKGLRVRSNSGALQTSTDDGGTWATVGQAAAAAVQGATIGVALYTAGAYARPAGFPIVFFFGPVDPGAAMQAGDKWMVSA